MKIVPMRRGRPRKFGRPARAVTLTLPEDVIAALSAVDRNLSSAAVRLLQPLVRDVTPHQPAELSKYGDSAVIVVKRTDALEHIPGVTLVPLPDGRALISLVDSMSLADFELKLGDVIDRTKEPSEKSVLSAIADIMKSARRSRGIAVHQRSIIVLQATRSRSTIASA
jgi:hypothetical protein